MHYTVVGTYNGRGASFVHLVEAVNDAEARIVAARELGSQWNGTNELAIAAVFEGRVTPVGHEWPDGSREEEALYCYEDALARCRELNERHETVTDAWEPDLAERRYLLYRLVYRQKDQVAA